MTFYSRNARRTNTTDMIVAEEKPARVPDALPAFWRGRDLILFLFLMTVVVPDIQEMLFAGTTVFFYWLLALLTFQLPSICVFSWLMRQAPPHVPIYLWILRLLREPWRSLLLFLMVSSMVLILLATIGVCLSLLQEALPSVFSALPTQCLGFVCILILATFFVCLPPRLFRIVLWGCGLLLLAFFVLLYFASFVALLSSHVTIGGFSHTLSIGYPAHSSWSLFGLTILALLGLNGPLFLDGEMSGTQRYLRLPGRYFWWGGLGSFVILLLGTIAWMILVPTVQGNLFQALGQILGPGVVVLAWLLLLLGSFGSLLAYFLVFSRIYLLATHLHAAPRYLMRLNRAGTPIRALLLQSALLFCAAFLLFIVLPALLRLFVPTLLLSDVINSDQFDLITSITASLWGGLNILMFAFALRLFMKKYRQTQRNRGERFMLCIMCLSGCLTSLVCAIAPLLPDWPSFFLSRNHWFPLILFGVACVLALAWVISELLRRSVLVREKAQLLGCEKELRKELQAAYTRECDLHSCLQEAYDEQQILILQQQLNLKEVNQLYREQERAAMTDPVTGLLNHRAFIGHLDDTISRGQQEALCFLLVFLDLDHFKAINDTWGHQAGDAVLSGVGQRLQEALRPGDYAGRYGGEEFALVLASATISQAYAEGERLRHIIQTDPYSWQCAGDITTGIDVTVSIGVAAYGIHGERREELLEAADLVMYQAKLDGRNCVRVADEYTSIGRLSLPTTHTPARCQSEQVEHLVEEDGNTMPLSIQALQGLVAMIQAHDYTTSSHACRLVWLAKITGQHLEASSEDLFLMHLGGLFHDIGKIGIPDAILNKAGSLNAEEWKVMRMHPVIGARILDKMGGFFRRLAPVVLAHHEWWDGTGYPHGLKGLEIPLASRVLGVVDAYDTMVSRRPYKDPMPESAAEAELRRGSGTQFDPVVVQTFLDVLQIAPEADPIDSDRELDKLLGIVEGDAYQD